MKTLFLTASIILLIALSSFAQSLNPLTDIDRYDLVLYRIQPTSDIDTTLIAGDTLSISFTAPFERSLYSDQPDPIFRGIKTGDSIYVAINNTNVTYSGLTASTNIIEISLLDNYYEMTISAVDLNGLKSKKSSGYIVRLLNPPGVVGNIKILILR